MRIFRSLLKNVAGTAAVETAVALPFIVLLGLGSVEYGFFINQIQTAQVAIHDAARYLARAPLTSCSGSNFNTYQANAIQILKYGSTSLGSGTLTSRTPRIQNANVGISCQTISNGGYRGGANIYIVQVSLTDFKPQGFGFLKSIVEPTLQLSAEERMLGG